MKRAPVSVRALTLGLAAVLVPGLLPGCGADVGEVDEAPDAGPGGEAPDLAPAGYPPWDARSPAICGGPPYRWLPAASVGATLEAVRKPSVSLLELQLLRTVALLGSQLNVKHSLTYGVRIGVIRYQTQDRGEPVDATAMVAWPSTSNRRFPVALFLHPTLGYTDGCAPSRDAAKVDAPMTVFAMLAASAGYVAVFPDYLNERSLGQASPGVNPYLLMEPTALASLDAVRAAQAYLARSEADKVTATSDVYLWGHSQGGQAVEFALALQPLYAPELALKAAAALSPPTDLAATARANFGGPTANFNLGEAIAYAWHDYYGGPALTTALLPPWDGSARTEMESYCKSGYVDPIRAVKDPAKVFTAPFLGTLLGGGRDDPWSCWLHYNDPATMGPAMRRDVPILYVTGEKDTTVSPAANQPVIDRWCREGAKIRLLQCSGADHTATIIDAIDDVLGFFDDRQAGRPLPADLCQVHPAVRCMSTP